VPRPAIRSTKGLAQLIKTYKMAQDNVHRLQDTFLEHLQRKRTPVTIFLANGVRLQGIVVGYDAFCVLLDCNGHQQIVYKHAVTTTVPAAAVDLQDKSGPVETIRATKPALIVERRRSRFAR
jgi:host factor-I protein